MIDMSNRSKLAEPALTELWEEHTAQEFVHKNVDATMRTMTAAPHVIAVPLAMGGRGWRDVRDYYARHFIGRTPQDLRLEPLSPTVDPEPRGDEVLVSLTQNTESRGVL